MTLPLQSEAIQQLKKKAETMFEPEVGKLLISDDAICNSAAGYYVGTWCIEYMGNGDWLPQPYERYWREWGYFPNTEKAQAFAAQMDC